MFSLGQFRNPRSPFRNFSDAFAGGAAADEAEGIEPHDGVGKDFLEGFVLGLDELDFKIRRGAAIGLEDFEAFEFREKLGVEFGEGLGFHFGGAGFGALVEVGQHAGEEGAEGGGVVADPFAPAIAHVFVDEFHRVLLGHVFEFVVDDEAEAGGAEKAGGVEFFGRVGEFDAEEGFEEDDLAAHVFPDGVAGIALGVADEEVDVLHDEGVVPGEEPDVVAVERFLALEGDGLPLCLDGGESAGFAVFFAGANVVGALADVLGIEAEVVEQAQHEEIEREIGIEPPDAFQKAVGGQHAVGGELGEAVR